MSTQAALNYLLSNRRTAIVIDDEEKILKKIEIELKKRGYNIETPSNLDDIKALPSNKCYAPLYIIDINLGPNERFGGVKFARYVKEIKSTAFCIAYTSDENFANRKEAKLFDKIVIKDSVIIDCKKIIQFYDKYFTKLLRELAELNVKERKLDFIKSENTLKYVKKKTRSVLSNEQPIPINLNESIKDKYFSDDEWANSHKGKFVAFIDGRLFEEYFPDINALISSIKKASKFNDNDADILIAKIEVSEKIKITNTRMPMSRIKIESCNY